MLPKVLGIKHLGVFQLSLFVLGLAGFAITAFLQSPIISQALHLLLILNFLAFVFMGLRKTKIHPPATFVFIALAMTADLIGTVVRVLILSGIMYPLALKMGTLLQYQAFPLLLILGVGGFLMPKLFGNGILDPKALQSQAGASIGVLLPLGLLFVLSYSLELQESHPILSRIGYGIRALIWAWFLFSRLGLHRIPAGLPAYLAGARMALYSIGAGLLLPVFFPIYTVAWEHLIFITGFLWVTISVATRVVFAHGGRLDLLGKNRKQTLGYGWLLVLAALTRVCTGIWTQGYVFHLVLASGFALIALVLWARINLPLVSRFPNGARP